MSPAREQIFVHEFLHAILFAEGYFLADLEVNPGLAQDHIYGLLHSFTNTVQHFEIFRRMAQTYRQNMEPYFLHKSYNLSARIAALRGQPPDDHDQRHQDIFVFMDMFLIGQHGSGVCQAYRTFSEQRYLWIAAAYEEMSQRATDSPTGALAAGGILRSQLVDYCLTHHVVDPMTHLWENTVFVRLQNPHELAQFLHQHSCFGRACNFVRNGWRALIH
jgi:hypothetical protein